MNPYRAIFPLLGAFDPEHVHETTVTLLERTERMALGRTLIRLVAGRPPTDPVELLGLSFPNRLGIAAGFDKDVRVTRGLGLLGFGHIEVGTITPRAQPGNPRPRIFRYVRDKALINRMGFPSTGIAGVRHRLETLRRDQHSFVVGVSLGKQKTTPLNEAHEDYVAVMRGLFPFADYFAINISSPNTPGLRRLQDEGYVSKLLATIREANLSLATQHDLTPRPFLLKIAPDLTTDDLARTLDAALAESVDGIIATNTTLDHSGLRHPHREETGGLSGAPLRDLSTRIVASVRKHVGPNLPIIGVGGVRTPADYQQKREAGADLVQVYTGLIYEGPRTARRILT